MTMPVVISFIGIIIGLTLLIYLVMKGVNIFVIAILCSSIVAITGEMNLYTALKYDYMGGFVDFFKNNFFIFLAGTAMGKMMEITNGAKAIAKMIIKWLGKVKALISIPLACGILLYGGVSMFVASFAVFPIALKYLRKQISKKIYSSSIMFWL